MADNGRGGGDGGRGLRVRFVLLVIAPSYSRHNDIASWILSRVLLGREQGKHPPGIARADIGPEADL
jgi:hypothetical protein